jgi:hypothetical protein
VAQKANALGDFLRARRQQVHPEDVGLIPGARRRVAGLRREELAMLAGISLAGATGTPRPHSAVEKVPDGLDEVIDLFPIPAWVVSKCLDVLAANPCARALSPRVCCGGKLPAVASAGTCRPRTLCQLG